jgi:hypothetical protein
MKNANCKIKNEECNTPLSADLDCDILEFPAAFGGSRAGRGELG